MYRITVLGYVGDDWSDFVGGMTVTKTLDEERRPVTTLIGEMVDQAMLLGVLNYLYDLCLPLVQVQWLDQDEGVSEQGG